jgi:hypothetical protein
MRKLLVLSIVVAALGGGVATHTAQASNDVVINSRITNFIAGTWHMQTVMGVHTTKTNRSYMRTHSARYRAWVLNYWKTIYKKTLSRFQNPPYESAWYCIHRFEGSWQDHGAPYYGGLQMDLGFQGTYGAYLLRLKGTADNWTPLEQMWVASKAAMSGRGFYPWPNSARICGLI